MLTRNNLDVKRLINASDDNNSINSNSDTPIIPELPAFLIDKEQIREQLALLGFAPNETVYLRSFYPGNDSRGKANNSARKAAIVASNIDAIANTANEWQSQGRGIYLVVNGGGHNDKSVKNCKTFFYEHDDLDKELSTVLWQVLDLPEPTFQVDTGGKSVHSYWVSKEPIDVEHWRILQTDLIKISGGDKALKNPSRVMRLAGGWHLSKHNQLNQQSLIISKSGKQYSFDELRKVIPSDALLTSSPPDIDTWGDMRNIAPYLDGYNPQGRQDWITCKCPVHTRDGGEHSSDSLHINVLSGKYICQSGCDNKDVFRESLLLAKDNGYTLADAIKLNAVKSNSVSNEVVQKPPEKTPIPKDIDERSTLLKLELAVLLQEQDTIKYQLKLNDICARFSFDKKTVLGLLATIETENTKPVKRSYNAAEFFDIESEALNWVVPNMVPRGETILLVAPPKAGKTLLAIDMAFAIATGESDFLGESIAKSKVLIISTDESFQSTRSKLLKRGFSREDFEYLKIMRDDWNINNLAELESELDDFRPQLVIVDSLKSITSGSNISENAAEFGDNIYKLKKLFNKYNSAAILIHHSGKSNEAMGVNKVRGSSAITGACWGIWILEQIAKPDPENEKKLIIDPSDSTRTLSIHGRDVRGESFKIQLNPENNSWEKIDVLEFDEGATNKEKILKALKENSDCKGLSGKQIQQLLNEVGNRAIYNELDRMVNRKIITAKKSEHDKRVTVYSLPD